MIERQPESRPPQTVRRRRRAMAARRRRTASVVAVGAGLWLLLAIAGLGSAWTTLLLLGGMGVVITANHPVSQRLGETAPYPRPPVRPVPTKREEEPPPQGLSKEFSDEYNTVTPAPPARQKRHPATAGKMTGTQTAQAAKPVRLKSPPPQAVQRPAPVPPPLLGNPDFRPLLAGHEPVARRVTGQAAPAEEAAPAQEAAPPAEEAPATMEAPAMEEEPPAEAAFVVEEAAPAVEQPARRPLVTPPRVTGNYTLPPLQMLPYPKANRGLSDDEILERASLLEETLRSFNVESRLVDFSFGPAVTRYELQPGPGVRVNKFTALADDLALALAAEDIRIEAPIPGKSAVGIEVPNKERLAVPLREVLESEAFRSNPSKLAVAFGKDSAGNPVVGDLARMPHLLIAGSTGSGKSVCMNTIISSLLFKATPDEVNMLMIDPKMVELSIYNGIPHLMAPVITDAKKAAGFLKGAVKEMEARYELFAAAGVRNIQQYNQMVVVNPGPDPEHRRQPLPYIVIFIDELADLMMVAPADVEDAICRLAQMARACGMHLVIATQSPRVDVITGLIKANVPSRIAFAVSSQVDSRVIMDTAGAERLLGRGDMLYHPSGLSKPIRAQGAFIDDGAVEELVRFVKAQGQPVFTAREVAVEGGPRRNSKPSGEEASPTRSVEAIFPEAVRVVVEHGQASISVLQRRLRCNYGKATRLIDLMEERGIIGPHRGSKPREVLMSPAQWREAFGGGDAGATGDTDP